MVLIDLEGNLKNAGCFQDTGKLKCSSEVIYADMAFERAFQLHVSKVLGYLTKKVVEVP
jgi:hypothetical protein